MADPEHLRILKQGVEAWNFFLKHNEEIWPDLRFARLSGANLGDADFCMADLRVADLRRADLRGAHLRQAILRGANLSNSDLRRANLRNADLSASFEDSYSAKTLLTNSRLSALRSGHVPRFAALVGANLRHANLTGTDLTGADLTGADLTHAYLPNAKFTDANLTQVDLNYAFLGGTILGDLRNAKNLESIIHLGPSFVSVDVLQRSQGRLPAVFLKGCGLSDWEIEASKLHNPNLSAAERTTITYEILRLQGEQPIQINPLFVSYSHADAAFVEMIEPRFDEQGIRFWRDVHELKAGRLETQIDRAIRLNPTVLLVLSAKSVESDWVEWEVATARKLEKDLERDVLCPVALDDEWKTCSWPGPLRREIEDYHILDFSGWRDATTFERQFAKLLDGLKLFYRPPDRS